MSLLLFQLVLVLATCLFIGWVAQRLGQARVIGEILGGIVLGPSVLGRAAPTFSAWIFPPASLGSLDALSTVGLVLFLFQIGSELDLRHLERHRATASLASVASILLPFGLAALIAPVIRTRYGFPNVGEFAFTIFFGVSMSITAFRVLARILKEEGLRGTELGASSPLCAALDDVTAWLLLAFGLTLVPSSEGGVSYPTRLLWLAIYLAVMLFVVRRSGMRLASRKTDQALSYPMLGALIIFALASAAVTDAIGIHPLFGAFVAGVCFPRNSKWQRTLKHRLEVVLSLVLLPLFFALTGLRTQLGLLADGQAWLWTLGLLVLATVGKMGGAVIGARLARQSWRFSLALGALLNTRGLVELIVLNIAYKEHVFSPALFTMLIVMALITTAGTVPMVRGIIMNSGNSEVISSGARIR